MSPITEALTAWRLILGVEYVVTSGDPIAAAERATFQCERRIPAILSPANRMQVQQCLEVAVRYQIPVYPISRGKNWGLGSSLPAANHCVLMNLGRMNRILAYDESLSYLTVEPGVTFAQAAAFLREHNSSHYLSVIGGPPDASLIGNALDRGDGVGRYGDRLLHACSMEVVLPTGECIQTGFSHYAGSAAANVHRNGVGPILDGLFSQSNFGIVTRTTFWLARKPSHFQSLLFTIESDQQMLEVTTAIQDLMALGVLLPNSVAIWNAYKFATTDHQYPWHVTGGEKPLRPDQLDALPSPWRGAKWIGVAGIYSASRGHARADRKMISQRLRPLVKRLLFVDRTKARLAMLFRQPLKRLGFDVDSAVRVLFAEPIFLGYPTKKSIGGCYWRKRQPVPADPDPDRDRCGVLWLCPAVPYSAEHIRKSVAICSKGSVEHGFEPHIAITFPSERCVYVLPSLLYDRDDATEDQAALRCHDEMFRKLVAAGYLPHRLGIQSMDLLPQADAAHQAVWQRLKDAFDPTGILAPGRYDFGGERIRRP